MYQTESPVRNGVSLPGLSRLAQALSCMESPMFASDLAVAANTLVYPCPWFAVRDLCCPSTSGRRGIR